MVNSVVQMGIVLENGTVTAKEFIGDGSKLVLTSPNGTRTT